MKSFARSDVGQRRSNNEDAFYANDEQGIYVVSDGMGGMARGEVASALAVEAVFDVLTETPAGDSLQTVAIQAVQSACLAVYERSQDDPECRGMGCTLTLLWIVENQAVMAHVGDSRLYLFRDGVARQLSTDHTMAAELARRGAIRDEEVATHPFAHVLTQTLGHQPTTTVETVIVDMLPGDRFLLCSDGLSNHVVSSELPRFLARGEQAAETLVAEANRRGGRDNITVVVVECDQVSAVPVHTARGVHQLSALPIFRSLRWVDVQRLLQAGDVLEFDEGQVIIDVNERLPGLYLVLDGQVDVVPPSGKSRTLNAGEAFGESALLVPDPSTSALKATADTTVFCLQRVRLEYLCEARPRLGAKVYRALAKHALYAIEASRKATPLALVS